jgi:hypothetical protein
VVELRRALALAREALEFSRKFAGRERLAPWEAWAENKRAGWHCWGCKGEFVASWPEWIRPTEETFPHEAGCHYVAYRRALLAPPDAGAGQANGMGLGDGFS